MTLCRRKVPLLSALVTKEGFQSLASFEHGAQSAFIDMHFAALIGALIASIVQTISSNASHLAAGEHVINA